MAHGPAFADMPVYFAAMPALDELNRFVQQFKPDENGNIQFRLDAKPMADGTVELLKPLLAVMTDLPVEVFDELPMNDSLIILYSIDALVSTNFAGGQEKKSDLLTDMPPDGPISQTNGLGEPLPSTE